MASWYIRSTIAKLCGVGFSVIKWCAVAHCTLEYVADCVICSGPSMEPTIKTKDIILVIFHAFTALKNWMFAK